MRVCGRERCVGREIPPADMSYSFYRRTIGDEKGDYIRYQRVKSRTL